MVVVCFKCWTARGSGVHIPARRAGKILGCQKAEGGWICAGLIFGLVPAGVSVCLSVGKEDGVLCLCEDRDVCCDAAL